MHIAKSMPTIFAQSIAESVGLMPTFEQRNEGCANFIIKSSEMRLIAFQQMAMACSFDECMLAYEGCELSEEQKTALLLIHKSTIPWLIGHVISEMIDQCGTKGTGEFLLTQLIKDGKVDPKAAKDLLVRLQVIDERKPYKG